jgi:hypothetical protein
MMNDGGSIRPYEAGDRAAIRHICCETGFLGQPVDPIFRDRDLFADFQTEYYILREPGNILIAEKDGRTVGYAMACTNEKAYTHVLAWQLFGLAPRVIGNLLLCRYNRATRAYLWWFVTRGWREVPRRPGNAAHFHWNLLPEGRLTGMARELLTSLEAMLRRRGVSKVYGQMVVSPGRRGDAVFERYGWKITDRKPISKFRNYVERDCMLATIEKEL